MKTNPNFPVQGTPWHKLAVASILGAALLAVSVPAAALEEVVDLELVLAVDASSSVSAQEFDLQIKGLAEAFRTPQVLAAIQASGDLGIAVRLSESRYYSRLGMEDGRCAELGFGGGVLPRWSRYTGQSSSGF